MLQTRRACKGARHDDTESRSHAHVRVERDVVLEEFCEAPNDCETKAHASVRTCSSFLATDLKELLEDPLAVSRRDADTRIDDVDRNATAETARADDNAARRAAEPNFLNRKRVRSSLE